MTPRFPEISVSTASPRRYRRVNPFRRFNRWFFLATALPVLTVGAVNVVIDPYGVFATPLGKFNHSKPKLDNNDRLFKAIEITRSQPRTIVMGSSRAKQGLDPGHPALAAHPPVYNLAINGPNFYEQRRYLEHAIANQPELKTIVLGIDFFAFNANLANQPTFAENRLEKRGLILTDFLNAVFSFDALAASQATIAESFKEQQIENIYEQLGYLPNEATTDIDLIEWRFREGVKLYFELHWDHQLSEAYLADFAAIVRRCQEKNIALKIFISPAHATQWEAIRATGRWETFEDWKRRVVAITPVWDFSGYNSVTTEAIASQMQNYFDNSHYTKRVGDWVFDRVFDWEENQVPTDFGVLLTPENIEAHLLRIREDRQRWAAANPQQVQSVKQLYEGKVQKKSKSR
ncbi:MAG: hypothetical protein HC890_15635 [Chloroflexaceae bacterium]|nr:hypothetical protein [Chloroflexaceae bacterium]